MHPGAYKFVEWAARSIQPPKFVVEFGSRDVNGSVRPLFSSVSRYVGIDLREGPGVDLVMDVADLEIDSCLRSAVGGLPGVVVCTECLEHTPRAAEICAKAFDLLDSFGVFILTAAGEGREPHSAEDGGPLREGEYYRNVTRAALADWLKNFTFHMIDDFSMPGDIYALAVQGW